MKLPVRRRDLGVPGFLFSGVACGLKDDGRKDVALIFAAEAAAATAALRSRALGPRTYSGPHPARLSGSR